MSYSVFVVIDCTASSFSEVLNKKSFAHSIQSIVSLLLTLSRIDLPSISIIITTKEGPAILCNDVSTLTALSPKSPVWVALFDRFTNPHDSNHIISALSSVLTMRMQQKTAAACCFIFSDGCYSKKTRETVAALTTSIEVYKTTVISIGIGNSPTNICKLSRLAIWSPNPKCLVNGINYLLGKECTSFIPEIFSFFTSKPTNENLFKYAASLIDKPDELVFKELHDELNKVVRPFEMFQNYYNAEQKEIVNAVANPEGEIFDLGKNQSYNGQSALFCMFWDHSMSYGEVEDVSLSLLKDGVTVTDKNGKEITVSACKALTDLGMKVEIVQDYKSAIRHISSGNFSQVHIICGRGDGKLPNGGNANLVGQFIECCIQYWLRGGALAWWADNDPLFYELNLFLEQVEFPDGIGKTKLRIEGNHYGDGMLRPSPFTDLQHVRSVFNEDRRIEAEGVQRPSFNFNLVSMYEGITVSYANTRNIDEMKPFKPFAVSSDGGVSILYYAPYKLDSHEGDIVIDCGFSKLFKELSEEGIYRYVRNMSVWLLSLEKKEINLGSDEKAKNFHPEPFEFNYRPYEIWTRFKKYNDKRTVNICFLIDGTESMDKYIQSVSTMCSSITNYCNNKGNFYFACVIYRDNAYTRLIRPKHPDENEFFNFTRKIDKLRNFLDNIKAKGGGGDGPEDWVSGYKDMLSLNWQMGSKVVIHITDAPSHGTLFNNAYENELDYKHDEELPQLIKEAAEMGILFHCICGKQFALKSFEKAQEIYESSGGNYFKIEQMGDDNIEKLQETVLTAVRSSVDEAVAIPTFK